MDLALRTLLREQSIKSVNLKIDNATALSYLVKKGGEVPCPEQNCEKDRAISEMEGNTAFHKLDPLQGECGRRQPIL